MLFPGAVAQEERSASMTYTVEQLKRNWRTDLHPEHLMDASGVISELFQEIAFRDRELSMRQEYIDSLKKEADRLEHALVDIHREVERLKTEGACAGERAVVVANMLDAEKLKTARECAEIAESAVGIRGHVEGALAVAAEIRAKFGVPK
jgi:hypothetical protein